MRFGDLKSTYLIEACIVFLSHVNVGHLFSLVGLFDGVNIASNWQLFQVFIFHVS
jgi:hypothetical protein